MRPAPTTTEPSAETPKALLMARCGRWPKRRERHLSVGRFAAEHDDRHGERRVSSFSHENLRSSQLKAS